MGLTPSECLPTTPRRPIAQPGRSSQPQSSPPPGGAAARTDPPYKARGRGFEWERVAAAAAATTRNGTNTAAQHRRGGDGDGGGALGGAMNRPPFPLLHLLDPAGSQ
jgi:hypothetical protein